MTFFLHISKKMFQISIENQQISMYNNKWNVVRKMRNLGMKKILALTLIIFIFLMAALPIGVCAKEFPDVSVMHDNYDAVMHLTDLGVIAGYEDGTFMPEREITRTEFCALMARTLGYDKNEFVVSEIPFSDVPKGYWGIDYISFCYERGLINGMGEGLFAPADKVTIAQAAKMAVCAIEKEQEALKIEGEKWYSGYMKIAERNGLTKNTDQQPDEYAVRANVAQIVYNMVLSELLPEDSEKDETITKPEEDDSSEDDEFESYIDKIFAEKDFSDVKVIVVDAGHNYEGKDTGAGVELVDDNDEVEVADEVVSQTIREEVITWQIADKLRRNLKKMGYTVVMTRNNLTDSVANTSTVDSLQARVDIAHTELADLFISIHCNMGGGTGIETYCFSKTGYSARLAELVQEKISDRTGLYDRGVKTSNFYVIKNTAMPSILIETAFMDNPHDLEIIISDEGQEQFAEAIAEAVLEYDRMAPLPKMIDEDLTESENEEDFDE